MGREARGEETNEGRRVRKQTNGKARVERGRARGAGGQGGAGGGQGSSAAAVVVWQ